MRRKSTVRRVLLLIFAMALFAVVPGALANGSELVENGGFEAPVPSGSWDIFPGSGVPGWTVEWTDPDAACGGDREPLLEIQKSGTVVAAYEGNQYAELDTDCQPDPDVSTNVKISQTIDTVAGFNYGLDFAWKQRTSSDAMKVVAPGFENYYDDTFPANWAPETVVFTATGATSVVSFEETGDPAQSLGMFLDAVSCEFCVSETNSELVYGRKNVPVGDVDVSHDAANLNVTFTTVPGWVIHLTHVDVVGDPADFPQNNGGLIPGQFDYGDGPHIPGVTSTTITIPIADLDFMPGAGTYYIATHAELYEVSSGPFWATNVLSSSQGLRGDNSPVLTERSDPDSGLVAGGAFYSLGFAGSIEVAFGAPVYNGDALDVTVAEVTNGTYPLETADVFGYYGSDYHLLGEVNNKGATAIDLGSLPYVTKIKIVDTSEPSLFPSNGDGFDLDGVMADSLVTAEESGWGDTNGVPVGKNWSMYFPFEFNCPQPLPE